MRQLRPGRRVFEFRILIYSLEGQKHSLDYAKNFWDTTLEWKAGYGFPFSDVDGWVNGGMIDEEKIR
jgi:hypothetical protein